MLSKNFNELSKNLVDSFHGEKEIVPGINLDPNFWYKQFSAPWFDKKNLFGVLQFETFFSLIDEIISTKPTDEKMKIKLDSVKLFFLESLSPVSTSGPLEELDFSSFAINTPNCDLQQFFNGLKFCLKRNFAVDFKAFISENFDTNDEDLLVEVLVLVEECENWKNYFICKLVKSLLVRAVETI